MARGEKGAVWIWAEVLIRNIVHEGILREKGKGHVRRKSVGGGGNLRREPTLIDN